MTNSGLKQSNVIKCKFCEWRTCRFYRRKEDSKLRSGYRKLVFHVMTHHEDKYKEIINRLDDELAMSDCSIIKQT